MIAELHEWCLSEDHWCRVEDASYADQNLAVEENHQASLVAYEGAFHAELLDEVAPYLQEDQRLERGNLAEASEVGEDCHPVKDYKSKENIKCIKHLVYVQFSVQNYFMKTVNENV